MEPAEHAQMNRRHIFAVNGAADFLDVLRDLFQDEDINVTTTNFVPHTFDQIAALHPSLVLIDLVVGQRARWELIARLGGDVTTRQVPLIIVSTNPQLLEQAHATFGDVRTRYLRKPLDLDDLMGTVRELIAEP